MPRCLILDHDDTAVNSTPHIHYPCHVDTLKRLRPGQKPVSLEEWYRKNFDPGIVSFLTGELQFTPGEMHEEYRMWQEYTRHQTPEFFPGFADLLRQFRTAGGLLTVVSHSQATDIERHYEQIDFEPDLILGWHDDASKRKPSPWPVEHIMRQFDLSVQDVLVIDDLKPGVTMARESGVMIAAAGWGHNVPEIESYMRTHCDAYFSTVDSLGEFLDLQ